jgi:hypothetical protein
MWGKNNKIATKWGATNTIGLNDGLGQGNNIAVFPDMLHGACAQFDLWRTGYTNMTLKNAILKWSGGNWSQPYANSLVQATGIGLNTVITPELLASEQGWKLMKAQAKWEAGQTYPLTDGQWQTAQSMIFNTKVAKAPTKSAVVAAGTATAATTVTTVATTAASGGVNWWMVATIVLAGIVVVGVVYLIIEKLHTGQTTPPKDFQIGQGRVEVV